MLVSARLLIVWVFKVGHAGKVAGTEDVEKILRILKSKNPDNLLYLGGRERLTGLTQNCIEALLYAGSIELCQKKFNSYCAT